MIRVLFWLAVVCCVVAQIEIVRSALKAPAPSPSEAPGRSVPMPRRWTEILWTVLPAVGLLIVLVATWSAIRAHDASVREPTAVSAPAGRSPTS